MTPYTRHIIGLIETYFGGTTARLYEQFYDRKDDATVARSAQELFSELLGERKAAELMAVAPAANHQ